MKRTQIASDIVLDSEDDSRNRMNMQKQLEDKLLLQQSRVKSRGVTISAGNEDEAYFGGKVSMAVSGSGILLSSALNTNTNTNISSSISTAAAIAAASKVGLNSSTGGNEIGGSKSASIRPTSTSGSASTTTTTSGTSSGTGTNLFQLDHVFRRDNSEGESDQIRAARESFIAERMQKHREKDSLQRAEAARTFVGVLTDTTSENGTVRQDSNIAMISTISSTHGDDQDKDEYEKRREKGELDIFETLYRSQGPSSSSSSSSSTSSSMRSSEVDATEGGERWLTGISEISLPVDVKLRNIERTEIARQEAFRQKERALHEFYLGSGSTSVGVGAGFTANEIDEVLTSNYNSNFKRHKREWDTSARRDSAMVVYLREKMAAEAEGMPPPPIPDSLTGVDGLLRDFSTTDDTRTPAELRRAAYERAMELEIMRRTTSHAADDKVVKKYIKNNRR